MDPLLSEVEFQERVKGFRGIRYPLLSHGGLTLIDASGGDRRIVDAARTTSDIAAKSDKDDRNLIRYLMRNRHTTPLEFPEATWLIECPMDLWRQWIRHRTATVNEFSSRYSDVPNINDETAPDRWRLQSQGNRQGSSASCVEKWPENVMLCNETLPGDTPGAYLTRTEQELQLQSWMVYEERLKFGIANEQARKDLCLSTYTKSYWKNDLHNTLHFLGLRMDSHAQWEIRQYANQMHFILSQLFPVTMQAFDDYRLNAMTLTAMDRGVIRVLHENAMSAAKDDTAVGRKIGIEEVPAYLPPYAIEAFMLACPPEWQELTKCRERDEALSKLTKLGIVVSLEQQAP